MNGLRKLLDGRVEHLSSDDGDDAKGEKTSLIEVDPQDNSCDDNGGRADRVFCNSLIEPKGGKDTAESAAEAREETAEHGMNTDG
jgi:hypothetical protein